MTIERDRRVVFIKSMGINGVVIGDKQDFFVTGSMYHVLFPAYKNLFGSWYVVLKNTPGQENAKDECKERWIEEDDLEFWEV